MKIFGREPALWIGLIGSILTVAAGLGLPWLSAGQAAALFAAVSAVLIAVATRPVSVALFSAAVAPVAILFSAYGLDWSDAMVSGVAGLMVAVLAFFGIRPQVTPVASPRTIDGQVVR